MLHRGQGRGSMEARWSGVTSRARSRANGGEMERGCMKGKTGQGRTRGRHGVTT